MASELSVGTRIDHDRYGEGMVAKVNLVSYDVYFARGGKVEILKSNKDYKVLEEGASGGQMESIDIDAFEKIINTHLINMECFRKLFHWVKNGLVANLYFSLEAPICSLKKCPLKYSFTKL